jgi:pilus assembly protein FimV
MSRNSVCQTAAAAALAFVLTGVAGASAAQAATADATASAPEAGSAPLAAGSQYTVRPGQSLNDVAIAATQSHDRATLVRASKALFDANPNAFMSHDPSRLRLGAVLTVPALDATGAAVAASGASGASASSGAAATSTSAASAVATGTAGNAAGSATTALGAASQPAAVSAGAASAAVRAAPAATATASAPSLASSAVAGAVASAPLAGSAAATAATGAVVGAASSPVDAAAASAAVPTSAASGAHVWTGAIQSSSSVPVAGASATPASPSVAPPVAQAPTQVSSLQQLLALKSRVLMELQKHGIGGKPAQPSQVGGAASAVGQNGAAAGSGLQGNAAVANAHAAPGNGFDLSPVNLGFAAAIGAAAVALLAALGMRRRKSRVEAAAVTPQAEETAGPETVMARDNLAPHGDMDEVRDADAYAAPEVAISGAASEAAAREAAEHEAAEREAAEHEAAAREALEQQAAERDVAAREAAAQEAAAHEAAAQEAAAREAAAQQAAEREATESAEREATAREAALRGSSDLPSFPASEPNWGAETPLAPASHSFEDATDPAGHSAFAEPGADVLPPSAEFAPESEHPAHQAATDPHQWDHAPAHPSEEAAQPLESYNPPQPQINFGAVASNDEPHVESSFGQAPAEPSFDHTWDQQPASTPPHPEAQWEQPTLPEVLEPTPHIDPAAHEFAAQHFADPEQWPEHPSEQLSEHPAATTPAETPSTNGFPRDAVDAFGSLDMGLPPRVEPAAPVTPRASLSTQPVVEPEITAQQAVPPQAAEPRHAAEEIAAGTAGSAAVAGLGAARFGALNLDFDLELPPSPAQPLPTFTPQDLVRIARNKLDLASEYIELGDLAGARALIHEVIEANDDATRAQARALLSTLAPLS